METSIQQWIINCPKHGEHAHVISSDIQGHEGHWCQLCFLEMLGAPLEAKLIETQSDQG